MATWHEITRDPEYQELTPEGKSLIKKGFFDRVIAADPEYQTFSEDTKKAIFDDFWQTPDDTGQGYVTSMLGAAGRGFGEMVPGAIEGVGALTGSEGLREFGQDVRGGLEDISRVNPIYGESIPVKLSELGGQIGSVLATAGAGGLAGKALGGVGATTTGMRAAPLASAFLQGSAEGAREAEQYGMTGPEAYLRTLAGGATEAGTELLPFGMAAETTLAKRLLTGAPRTGTFLGAVGSEAGEEGLGQIASNIATKALAPAGVETPDITTGALEAAAYGAAGGAMIGGVNALISTPPERQTQIQKDRQAEFGDIPKDTVPDQTNEEKMAAMEKGGVTVVSPDGKTAVIAPEPSMPDPAEVAKTISDASVEQLAATGNEASAADQADFNAILTERLGETPKPAIQPEQAPEEVGAEVTPSPNQLTTEEEPWQVKGREWLGAMQKKSPKLASDLENSMNQNIDSAIRQGLPFFGSLVDNGGNVDEGRMAVYRELFRSRGKDLVLEKPIGNLDKWKKSGVKNFPVVDFIQPQTPSPVMEMPSPPQGVDMASAPVSPIITEAPLSEGAERNRAVIEEAAAKLRGEAPQDISAGLQAAIPQQPVETQEDAAREMGGKSLVSSPTNELSDSIIDASSAGVSMMDEHVAVPAQSPQVGFRVIRPDLIDVVDSEKARKVNPTVLASYFPNAPQSGNITTDGIVKLARKSLGNSNARFRAESSIPAGVTLEAISSLTAYLAGKSRDALGRAIIFLPTGDLGKKGLFAGLTFTFNGASLEPTGLGTVYLPLSGPTVFPLELLSANRATIQNFLSHVERDVTKETKNNKDYANNSESFQESLRQEPQDRIESREAEETGVGDSVQRAAEGEKEVGLPVETEEQRFVRIKAMKPSQRSDEDVAFANAFSKRQKEAGLQIGETTRKEFLKDYSASTHSRIRKALDQGMNFRGLQGTVGSWVETLFNEGWRMAIDARGNRQFTDGKEALGSSGLGKVGMNYADFLSSKKPPSPPTTGAEPTTATEGMVTPGGVATERDVTKPEQMTPAYIQQVKKSQLPVIEDSSSGIKTHFEKAAELELTSEQVFDIAVAITKEIHSKGGSANIQDILDSATPAQIKKHATQPKPTPDSVAVEPGATRGVQAEPVGGSIPTDEKVSPETETTSSGKLDPKLIEAEKKQAKADKAAEKKRKKREEMRSKAIDSIIGASEKKKRKFGQVTNSDAIAAVAMLVSSKDIPGVLTTWWGTKEDFLRDPANQKADPEIYARIKAGELVEGFFNKGRAYIFLDGIGVSENDMLRGEQMDVSPQIAAVRRVLLHESLVHRGIHGLPLRHRRKILNWVKENSTPAELDDLAKLYTEYANWRNSEYEFEALAEELLAKKVDSLTEIPKDGPMAKLMDILRQIWDFIVGYKREPTLSDLKSVVKLLKSGAESLANDALKDGSQVKLSMIAPTARITPKMDAEYLAAVEAGDMEKAQRMVDEAAKAAGYNVGPVYHGTEQKGLTEFFGGWWSDQKATTKEFGRQMYSAFLRGPLAFDEDLRPLYIEFNGTDIDPDSDESISDSELGDAAMSGGPFSRLVQEKGFQGIAVWDESNAVTGMAYAVFNPSQIKSADPVTRDDAGNVIPLSQRFQQTSSDIRFSRPEFASETSAAFTAGSEAARSTLYSERDMDIREAIRRAYEAMPKTNSVAVPIGELFEKVEELMPGVTQDEFSNVLQDLFEDNGAVLQEGEQITPEQEAEIQSFEKDNPFNELIRKSPQKSPSLGEINGVSKKFVQRVLRPTSSFAANNGIRIDDNAPLQARAMPDGGIVIGYSIPQERFDELQKMAPQAASQYTKDSVIEELIHVSDLIGLRNQWIKSGKRLSFDQFVLGEQSKLAFSLIQKAESLNDTEAESLRRILASSLSLYNNNPEIANLGLNELLELAAQYPYVLPELVRSLIQLKKTGQLTETAFRKIANLLRKWQEIVLQWISDGYASAKEGVFGEMISERIKNAENNLAQLSDAAEINVTTPEGRRAGFVVVMPRAAKASRIKAEDASDAAKTFQADIIEAGKGRIDTDSYQGNTLKSTEAPDHNVNAPELYKDAAISLVDSLLKNHSITEIADSFQDPEFRVAVGLLGNKAINPNVAQQAELFTGAEIQNRLENSLNKERNPAKKRIIEKTLKNHKAYYTTATGIGQNLNAVGALQQDPRFKWMFMFNEAEKEMADKAKEKLDIITGGGTQPVTDTVNQSEEAAADEATKEMTSDAEEDQDAIDLAAGEETLDERLKRLYEELKDWLRTKGAIVRARAARKSANAAKASLSKEQRDAIMQMSDEELDALEKKADENIERILNTILGKESEAKTPEQKKTRAKRKKMVDTAKKRAEAGKEISPEAKEAAAIEMAENKASQIVYRFEELYRQGFKNPPEGMSKKEQKDSIIKAFRDQVKNPTSFEAFAERLANLKVGAEVAERMFLTASRERADLIRVKDFKIAKRKVEIADKQASRLIYATEERFRQGSKDLNESKDGDSINKAFRDQVSTPVSESDFSKRLAKLNVSPDVATRLFKTAAREKADLEAMEAFKLIEGPDALKRMLAEINKARPGQEAPFSKQIPWREILSQRAKTVEEYRQRIFDAISSNEAFQNLPDDKKAKLADLFSEAWESKRKDILDRMLEREIERKRREGSLSEAAAKALQKSRNKIIELANLGGFDNDDLMKVLGEKFGIKTGFSEAEKARISELADKLQDETLNPAKRNKLAMEFAVTLAGASEIPVAEIIANWWTSSVLFGPQTIFSIGAAFVNGAYSITTIGTRRMLADLTRGDVKGAIEESILMLQGIAKYLGAFKQAGRRAWSYLWTGNVDVLGAAANDILGEINSLEELKRFKRHKLLAENLAKDPRALRRYVGMYLRFVNRLLTSLDAFNVMVTKAGTASLALRMSGMSTDNIIKAEKMLNLKSYKDQVIRDYFDNKAPTTQAEKALVDSYAEAAMYRAVDQLGGKMENADYLASESAMTMNPTGLGGFFYRSITGLDSKMKKAAEDYLEKAKKDWTTEKDLESTLFLGLAYLRQFAVQNLGGVAGYKFIRFASNKFNQGISYLPMVGLLRTLEAKGDDIKGKEAFIETIHRNQVIGAVLTLAALAVVKALEEEPDDEERGNFWNGGWQNLTPDQKKQMLAKGQKEYTMGFKFNGRWYVFNYQNWPLNQILAAIGSMSDQIRFSPKQWEEKGPLSKSLAGIVSGLKSTLEIPALSQLGELAGNRLASKDPTEQTVDRLSRVASGWVGGFVPRILKDLDFATQPELRKYKTLWEKTASHIPIYRRYVGEDYYDILGQPIKRNVIPGSREFMMGPTEPEYKILGALNSRNIFLTPANAEYRMVGKGRNRRRLTQEEADAYSLETGKGYRQMLLRYGQRALQMPTERARAFLSDKADEVRDRALKKVYRR